MRGVRSVMRAVGRLGGTKEWMPHTLGHSETPEERAVRRTGGAAVCVYASCSARRRRPDRCA